MATLSSQQKDLEVTFFDHHAAASEYNVFTPRTNALLIQRCLDCCALKPGDKVLDVGCGSGAFSNLLTQRGLNVTGVDLSPNLIARARELQPSIPFLVEDAEQLSFPAASFDAVFLGGVIHHFPDPSKLAAEVFRVVKPGGAFYAFDPNRLNPIMFLLRAHASPLYNSVGVTPNEQPVLPRQVGRVFAAAGFDVTQEFVSVGYQYVAPSRWRWLVPTYNIVEKVMFFPFFLKRLRAFVLTWGRKAAGSEQ